MLSLRRGSGIFHLYHLVAIFAPVWGGDPSQQHPITVAPYPHCLVNGFYPQESCNFTTTKVDDCTYRHCHVQLPTGCTDWWSVLDLNCLCKGIGSTFCTQSCPSGLQSSLYFDWLADTCTAIPTWDGLPADTNLNLSSSVVVLSTDLSQSNPSCLANQDLARFKSCAANTTEVISWIPEDSRINASFPWQLDQTCFCDGRTYSSSLNGSDCATGDDATHAQLLIWLNTYCGTYDNFRDDGMPTNWTDLVPVFNATAQLKAQDLEDFWNSNRLPRVCGTSWTALNSRCDAGRKCTSLSDCDTPIAAIDRSCICASSNLNQQLQWSWCNGNHICMLKFWPWFQSTCGNATAPYPAILLLPWSEKVLPNTIEINTTTNVAINVGSRCPSTTAKLAPFAFVNAAMALLVPVLGRRTVINKLSRGVLGNAHTQTWIVTGIIGLSLHLISNAANAKLIQSTPGYENVSISHLVLLWCTRPRLAWLIVAFVPVQASKAMYFAAAAATLTTESILQLIGAVYVGIVANYGVQAGLYSSDKLSSQFNARSSDARIMYAGAVFALVVGPLSMLVLAWSVFGISNHVRTMPSYILRMEATTKKIGEIANKNTKTIRQLKNNPRHYGDDDDSSMTNDVDDHYRVLQGHWDTLENQWRALHASAMPISKELRRQRRERTREIQHTTDYERLSRRLRRDISDRMWFEGPSRRMEANEQLASEADNQALEIEQQRLALSEEMEATGGKITDIRIQERETWEEIDAIDAETLLLREPLSQTQPHQATLTDFEAAFTRHQLHRRATQDRHDELMNQILDQTAMFKQLDDLEQQYKSTIDSCQELAQCRRDMLAGWKHVLDERSAESARDQAGQRLKFMPVVVVSCMLFTWVAQWVWWIGFVRVARDTYCPPKISGLTTIWTIFSALSVVIGASV